MLIAYSLAVAIHVELVERARRNRLTKLLIVAARSAWLAHTASFVIEAVGIHVALVVAVLRAINRLADDRACTIMIVGSTDYIERQTVFARAVDAVAPVHMKVPCTLRKLLAKLSCPAPATIR